MDKFDNSETFEEVNEEEINEIEIYEKFTEAKAQKTIALSELFSTPDEWDDFVGRITKNGLNGFIF